MGKRKRATMLALAAVVMLMASVVPASAHNQATRQSEVLHAFPGGDGIEPMNGSARLVRTDNGVSFRMQTDKLTPGDVVTVWYVIFNNPGACESSPCKGSDLGNDDADGTVMWAAGSIVGGNGTANWAGHLSEGQITVPHPGFLLSGRSLKDARSAEIHLVVHSHGPARPGYINDQLRSFWTEGDTLKDLQAVTFLGEG